MQITATSEKAFTPISNDEIWLEIVIESSFEGYTYICIYTQESQCVWFIYLRASRRRYSRISFNTLHLLFTSCIPAPWKPMSEDVFDRALSSFLSKYASIERIFLCLTSELLSRICEKLPLPIFKFKRTEILRKVRLYFVSNDALGIHTPCSIIALYNCKQAERLAFFGFPDFPVSSTIFEVMQATSRVCG